MNNEILGLRLNTIHNLHFLIDLMGRVRQALLDGQFPAFRDEFLGRYRVADAAARENARANWKRRQRSGR